MRAVVSGFGPLCSVDVTLGLTIHHFTIWSYKLTGVLSASVLSSGTRRSRVRIPLEPWFFHGSSFQLLRLENLLRWSFFTLIYHHSSHRNYFIYNSHHFTPHGRYELNNLTSLPMCGFIAQLVEHRIGIAEVAGSNPVEALIFFRLLLSNCLDWKIYCDDHSSLWSTTTVHIGIISYIIHILDDYNTVLFH